MSDTASPTPDAPDTSETGEPVSATEPTTEDGIPLLANGRRLTAAQVQALREARDRRAAIDAAAALPPERGGSAKPGEPTRYGDWERAGRAYDF